MRADSAYNAEHYTAAADLYREALTACGPNTTLYYNLGNTCFRLGQTGKAVLNYERALRVDPSNSDARDNLRFVLSKIDNLPEDDSAFLSNLHHGIIGWMSPNAWAWTATALCALVLLMIGLYLYGNNVMVRKTGFFGGIVMLFIAVYVCIVSYSAASAVHNHTDAVVIVPVTNLNTAPRTPRSSADKYIPMPEGARLHIVDSLATPADPTAPKWYDVKINNSTRAWVNANHVERI